METVTSMMEVTLAVFRREKDGAYRELGQLICISGLASSGLTPFEQGMDGKGPGEKIEYDLELTTAPQFFGHLWPDMYALLGFQLPQVSIPLVFEIKTIAQPEAREIVRQLARLGGHGGCGGSCGCGCS